MKAAPRYLLCIAMAIAMFSCVKDELLIINPELDTNPNLGSAIATLTLQADKLIEHYNDSGFVDVGENGSISVVYRAEANPVKAKDLLHLDGFEYKDTINFSASQYAELIGNGSVTIQDNKLQSLKTELGDRLDSIRFGSGVLTLHIISEGNFPLSGWIKIKNADQTEAFVLDFSHNQAPVNVQHEIDFENLLMLLQNTNTQDNAFGVEYEITFTSDGNYPSKPVYLNFSLSDFSIKSAGGYIAPRYIDFGNHTVELEVFKNPNVKRVRVEDPRLNFNFENYFGLGMGIYVESVTAEETDEGNIFISNEFINQLPPIAGSTEDGVPAFSTLSVNNDLISPTVTDLLSYRPTFISSHFGIIVNPEDLESVFITDEHELLTDFEVYVPMFGSIQDFLLVDTTSVDFGNIVEDTRNITEVDEASLRLIINNGFPFAAGTNLEFVDENYQPIYSLFNQPELIFAAAPVNLDVPPEDPEYGRAVGTSQTIVDFVLPREKLMDLENAKYVIVTVFGNTTGNGDHPIRLFADDAFHIKLSAEAKFNLNLKL